MQTKIRLTDQHYHAGTGQILAEAILGDDKFSKAEALKELGCLHVEQIDFLQKIQDFKIKHQIMLNALKTSHICHSKNRSF